MKATSAPFCSLFKEIDLPESHLKPFSDNEFEEFQMAVSSVLSSQQAETRTPLLIVKHISTIFKSLPDNQDSLMSFLSSRRMLLIFQGLYLPVVQNVLRHSPDTMELLENLEEDCIYWNDQITRSRPPSSRVCDKLLARFFEVREIELVVE